MTRFPRSTAAILAVSLAVSATCLVAADKKKKKTAAEAKPATPVIVQMDESKRAVHVLNRLTFGARPGDAERVAAVGVDEWIEQQLHPERIDDSALSARLGGFKTLAMTSQQMVEAFPPPQVVKAIADGRLPLPKDPEKRMVMENAVQRYEDRQDKKANAGEAAPSAQDMDLQKSAQRLARANAALNADDLMAMNDQERMQALLKMTPEERRALVTQVKPEDRQKFLQSVPPEQRQALQAIVNPQAVVGGELQQAKLLRAAYSERQLEEVMTDFWFNHFNVFLNKGADRYMVTSYERDVIRPHVFGKFEDLLVATAKSPAMMFYLDNWQSVGPNSLQAQRQGNLPAPANAAAGAPMRPPMRRAGMGRRRGFWATIFGTQPKKRQAPATAAGVPAKIPLQRRAGLNENYGRELMELHTLGVDGGYTQQDVTEVAKVFTGWTLRQPRQGGDFDFNPRMHETGTKLVLGHEIKENGENEGREVLHLLAHHPATAHFIARKLAMRFVSDTPSKALVERLARAYQETDGDIRQVLRALFHSPEFWAQDAYRAKVKTPLEFVASAIRATGADVTNAQPFVGTLNQMGMPLYQMQPPTGYSMKAESWVNSAALLARMNFALRLSSGRMPGTTFDPQRVLNGVPPASADAALPVLENALLAGDVSKQTHETIEKQLQERAANGGPRNTPVNVVAGLILGSPEFQRR